MEPNKAGGNGFRNSSKSVGDEVLTKRGGKRGGPIKNFLGPCPYSPRGKKRKPRGEKKKGNIAKER